VWVCLSPSSYDLLKAGEEPRLGTIRERIRSGLFGVHNCFSIRKGARVAAVAVLVVLLCAHCQTLLIH
jgi:hypothetical protein